MDYPTALRALARELGIHTHYVDGFGIRVDVADETLAAVCTALGAPADRPNDVHEALSRRRRSADPEVSEHEVFEPVLVAWDGVLPESTAALVSTPGVRIELEDGTPPTADSTGSAADTRPGVTGRAPLPWGYHTLIREHGGRAERATIISAPRTSYQRPGDRVSWGLGTHAAALRFRRSRAIGDLADLERVGHWAGEHGGDLITVLPLLPTFNQAPAEPSPYSAVSRLFWSELMLDLGDQHRSIPAPDGLSVERADAEVRAALRGAPVPPDDAVGEELAAYARFRGAQRRLGRNWRDWPEPARLGTLHPVHVDPAEEAFHRVAQHRIGQQMDGLISRLEQSGVSLGLDLPVGSHPDGYDTWSRRDLFAQGVSVGAPPDPGFANGQDWGFPPVLPAASRAEGHRYLAAAIRHQARVAGVLRVDHVMAWSRLFWIPSGAERGCGTYVSYPEEELFAVLSLESHRHRCEVIGENLGTVPESIEAALPRHGVNGYYLAQFAASGEPPEPPRADQVASIGSHDTPTLAGWIAGADIEERLHFGLLPEEKAGAERETRRGAVHRLAQAVAGDESPDGLLLPLLAWLGGSASPLVVPWIEDLWLEPVAVNLPGTASDRRGNWQRPAGRLLDDVLTDPVVLRRVRALADARRGRNADEPS